MRNKLAILLAYVLLGMQLLSFQHMAEHGFNDHKHNGKPCDIEQYFNISHSFDSASNAPSVTVPVSYVIAELAAPEAAKTFSCFVIARSPRAPPRHLQA